MDGNYDDQYGNMMSLNKDEFQPLENNHRGRQSLITLTPNVLSEIGDKGNSNPNNQNEIEMDELEVDELDSREDLKQQLMEQNEEYEGKQNENSQMDANIIKNSTIKKIVGYKPKIITNEQQLNDAIESESNIPIEEQNYIEEDNKSKVSPYNSNTDNNNHLASSNEKVQETKSDKYKQQKEDNEERNYKLNQSKNDGGNKNNKTEGNIINTNDYLEEKDNNNNQKKIRNNNGIIKTNNQSSNKNASSKKTTVKPLNSISFQENMTIGYNRNKSNVNYNDNNNQQIQQQPQQYQQQYHQPQHQEELLITSIPKIQKPFHPPDMFNFNTKTPYHQQQQNPHVPLSRLQVAENKYISIKESISKLFNSVDTAQDESQIDYNTHIEKMLIYLEQLNLILNILIESKKSNSLLTKAYSKKTVLSYSKNQLDQIEESNAKLLNLYEKQYQSMKARYDQISDKSYILNIQQQTKELDEKISLLESDNRQLRTNQVISENIFIKKINEENNTNRLKKMATESERYQLEYEKIVRKIDANQIIIKDNNLKIEKLLNRERELKKSAKEKYGLEEFDNIRQVEKKEKEKEEMIQKYKKKIQIINHAYKVNQKKFNKEIEDNQRTIAQLEIDRNELMELLNQKKGLNSEETLILDTNNGSIIYNRNPNENNTNNLSSINSVSVPPNISNSLINSNRTNQGNRRYILNQTVPTNQNEAVNKEMVLKELEKKQRAEELLHNISLDDPKVNQSIVLKKIALKPNFSFNKKQLNEVNNARMNQGKVQTTDEANDDDDNIIEEINEEKRKISNNNFQQQQQQQQEQEQQQQEQQQQEQQQQQQHQQQLIVEDKEKRRKDAKRKRMLNTPMIDDIIIGGVDKEDDYRNDEMNINEDEYDENEHEHIFEVDFDNKKKDHVNIQFNEEDD